MTAYPHVFSPITIGPIELANRAYLPPHGISLVAAGPNQSTVPSGEYAAYFRERAAAGVGLVVHSVSVNGGAEGISALNSAEDEAAVPAYRAVADGVHEVGGKIFGEIWYYWNHFAWEPGAPPRPFVGPTAVQRSDTFHVARALTERELRRLAQEHVRTARNLHAAGYDGIELHASHGTLLEQFLSPYFNRRSDAYGGDLTGRMRLLVETLTAVRDAIGDAPLGIRATTDERIEGGLDLKQSAEILDRLKREGLIDFVDLDFSHEPQQKYLMTPTYFVEPLVHQRSDIGRLRDSGALDGLTVMAAGRRVTSVAQMQELLSEGLVDMVGSVRGLMAEPELLRNALAGREDDSRACLSCNNQWGQGTGFTCVINPAVGREARWGTSSFTPAPRRVKTVVVGGGPAGLEAARVAAMRGHEVVLFEQRSELGGLMKAKASLPGRGVYQRQIDWWERRVAGLGVEVRTSTMATAEVVLAESPDAVVLAAGSTYDRTGECGWYLRPLPGADLPHVLTADDVLLAGERPTGTVLVFDGEGISTGPGVAELLAGDGARAILVTPYLPGRAMAEAPDALARVAALGVEMLGRTQLLEIGRGEVVLAPVLGDSASLLAGRVVGDSICRQGIDAVVLASQRKSAGTQLEAALDGSVETLYVIGDALAPRDLRTATYEAQRFARLLGEPDAPATTSDLLFEAAPEESFRYVGPAAPLA